MTAGYIPFKQADIEALKDSPAPSMVDAALALGGVEVNPADPPEKSILLTDIHPNDWNPNRMTAEEHAELVAEIKHLGRVPKPVVLRRIKTGYEIVDGEQAYHALIELAWKELQPGQYEIIKADNFEAMRQMYKRNQHGKHDKLKEGLLFKRLMDERKLSQRDLAEQVEVSEGTIRNALEYAKAAGVRNDYAFSNLTVEQVRTYNRLPRPFADVWLQSGCADRVLFWQYSEKELRGMPIMSMDYQSDGGIEYAQKMIDAGLGEKFPLMQEGAVWSGAAQHIAEKMQALYEFYEMESKFCHGVITHEILRPYTVHFLNKKWPVREESMMRKALKDLMRDDGTFIATPEEFTEWVSGSNNSSSLDEMIGLRRVNLGLTLAGPDVELKVTAAKIRETHPIPEIEKALEEILAGRFIAKWRLNTLLELATQKPIDNQFNKFKPSQHPDEFRQAVVVACNCISKKPEKLWPWTQEHNRLWFWLSRMTERLVERKMTVMKSDYELLMEIREVFGKDENLEPLAGLSRHVLEELCNALRIVKDRREFFAAFQRKV